MEMVKAITSGILIFFSSVGLVTKFEFQDIKYDKNYLNKSSYSNHKVVNVAIHFDTTQKIKRCIIPLIYTHDQRVGPYRYTLIIKGPIDDFVPKTAYFLVNNKSVKVNIEKSRWKEFSDEWKGLSDNHKEHIYYVLHDELILDWETLEEFRFIIDFIGIKDGKETYYKKELIFKKEHRVWKGNYIFDALMSV